MENLISQKKKGTIALFGFIFLLYAIIGNAFGEEGVVKKTAAVIDLPDPLLKGEVSVEEAIGKRRSVRSFSNRPLTTGQISQLLWATQGITDRRGLRAAPSAGALYPLEVYLVSGKGVFRYIPEGHKIELLLNKDIRTRLAQGCWSQMFIAQAPVIIAICAVYERVGARYGDRGARYVDIEVGHAAENLHLQAVALGLGSVPIGAFNEEYITSALNLSSKEKCVYIIPVGYER